MWGSSLSVVQDLPDRGLKNGVSRPPVKVWLSLGSNIDREAMLCAALRDLAAAFGELLVSPVYVTPAEGFRGDDFYNLVVGIHTNLPFADLHTELRAIEAAHGRVRTAEKFSPRTLDIDVLTYGEAVANYAGREIPNKEILQYAYVLKPLADVAPHERHPESGVSYQVLWQEFGQAKPDMQRIYLDCQNL